MSKRALPTKGAAFFFEGHEYEFEGVDRHGHLTFRRPEGGDATYKRVTIDPRELARSAGSRLADHARDEHGHWMRRLPPAAPAEMPKADRKRHEDARRAFASDAAAHSAAAVERLKDAAGRQFYHLEADPQDGFGARPLRLMRPPTKHLEILVPKPGSAGGDHAPLAAGPGALAITQTPPREG